MKIAIIEDEALELEQLEQAVNEIAENELPGMACEVTSFATIQAFEAADLQVDLLILDLHLPDGNGLALARRLKKERADTGVIIITAYREHVCEGYEVGAFRFLTKPLQKEKLQNAILDFTAEYRSMKYVLVPTQTKQLVIPLNEIVCIESQGKRSVVYLQDGQDYDSKKSIAEYAEDIENKCFCRVHRRFLVNMKHIVRVEENEIVFDMDRCHAEISRRSRAVFETRFAAFLKTL